MSYVQKLSYFTKKIYVYVKRTDVVLLKGEVEWTATWKTLSHSITGLVYSKYKTIVEEF